MVNHSLVVFLYGIVIGLSETYALPMFPWSTGAPLSDIPSLNHHELNQEIALPESPFMIHRRNHLSPEESTHPTAPSIPDPSNTMTPFRADEYPSFGSWGSDESSDPTMHELMKDLQKSQESGRGNSQTSTRENGQYVSFDTLHSQLPSSSSQRVNPLFIVHPSASQDMFSQHKIAFVKALQNLEEMREKEMFSAPVTGVTPTLKITHRGGRPAFQSDSESQDEVKENKRRPYRMLFGPSDESFGDSLLLHTYPPSLKLTPASLSNQMADSSMPRQTLTHNRRPRSDDSELVSRNEKPMHKTSTHSLQDAQHPNPSSMNSKYKSMGDIDGFFKSGNKRRSPSPEHAPKRRSSLWGRVVERFSKTDEEIGSPSYQENRFLGTSPDLPITARVPDQFHSVQIPADSLLSFPVDVERQEIYPFNSNMPLSSDSALYTAETRVRSAGDLTPKSPKRRSSQLTKVGENVLPNSDEDELKSPITRGLSLLKMASLSVPKRSTADVITGRLSRKVSGISLAEILSTSPRYSPEPELGFNNLLLGSKDDILTSSPPWMTPLSGNRALSLSPRLRNQASPTDRGVQAEAEHLISKLPMDVLDRLATYLAPKDLANLAVSDKTTYSSIASLLDIRTLYSRNHTYAEYVSPVRLYHFCIEDAAVLIPAYYTTQVDCFANVDRMMERSSIPIYRLQFMYDLIQATPSRKEVEEIRMHVFDTLLMGTAWSSDQLSSLLLFAAPRSAVYYRWVFEKVCLIINDNTPSQCETSLLLAPAPSIALLRPLHYYESIYGSKEGHWDQQRQAYEGRNNRMCFVGYQTIRDSLEQFIMNALASGADIHHPCVHRLLEEHYSARGTSIRRPFAFGLLEDLIEWGYAVNDVKRNSLLLAFEDLPLVQLLLDAGASVDNLYGRGYTALHYACRKDDVGKVELLLQYGANPNFGGMYQTTLMVSETPEINDMLIQYKANVNFVDREGYTPIFSAVSQYQSVELTDLLLTHGADVLHTTAHKKTVLMLVRNVNLARLLMAPCSSILNAQDDQGMTAVHYAVMYWSHTVLGELIAAGADLNVRDASSQTALMKADDVEATLMLLSTGKIEVNVQDRYGYTALMFAVIQKHVDRVQVLLDYGALLNVKNADGHDALMLAESASFASGSKLSRTLVRVLREHKAAWESAGLSLHHEMEVDPRELTPHSSVSMPLAGRSVPYFPATPVKVNAGRGADSQESTEP